MQFSCQLSLKSTNASMRMEMLLFYSEEITVFFVTFIKQVLRMECGSETGRNSLVFFIYKVSRTVFCAGVAVSY